MLTTSALAAASLATRFARRFWWVILGIPIPVRSLIPPLASASIFVPATSTFWSWLAAWGSKQAIPFFLVLWSALWSPRPARGRLVVVIIVQQTTRFGAPTLTVSGAPCNRKGQKGGDKHNEGERDECIGKELAEFRFFPWCCCCRYFGTRIEAAERLTVQFASYIQR